MKKFLLILVIFFAFVIRLHRLNFPLADWHSWRQSDTSAVSRNFIKIGFDIFHPRFDDLSNVASGLPNPQGYRFVEFPIYNVIQAGAFRLFPFFNLVVWGRLVSIFASLGSLVFLYLITGRYLGHKIAILAAFFFAVLPFNVYYSRVVLPEPIMVMASLGMIYFFNRWIEESKWRYCCAAALFGALSFLLKPYSLVFLLPIAYIGWRNWRFSYLKWLTFLFSCSLALLPFLLWRRWMNHFPEGIPAYDWLFNEAGIRFKGAFFYWLFAERLGKLILGYWGILLFGLGIIIKPSKKEGWFFYSWLAAVLVYLFVIAGGNVRHDYYQILTIPIICVFLAKGTYFLLNPPKGFSRLITYQLLLVALFFMLAFSWYQVRDYFNINNPAIVKAGKAVDGLVPKEALVVAPYGGDTTFLYQTNRRGWPVGIEIEKMIKQGAEYYVNVNFGPETEWLEETYCVVEKTPEWVVIDLKKKCDF